MRRSAAAFAAGTCRRSRARGPAAGRRSRHRCSGPRRRAVKRSHSSTRATRSRTCSSATRSSRRSRARAQSVFPHPAGRWLRPRRPRSRGRARRGHPAISVDDVDAHRANHRRLRHGGARDRIGTHRAQSAWRHDRARIEPRAVVRAWQPRAIVQGSGAGAASGERPMSPRRISTQRPQRPLVITLFVSVTSVVSEWS